MSILLLLFLGLHSVAHQSTPNVTSVRVADAVCVRCHEQIYNSYLKTTMAEGSGLAGQKFVTGSYKHKPTQVIYTFIEKSGKPILVWKDGSNTGASGEHPLSYYLGSGHFGTTWLYSTNGYLFESPVAWYTASHKFYMKPGLAQATKRLPALTVNSNCLRCHMSAVQPTDVGTLNHYSGLPFLHSGITCEACHGGTRQHVLSGGKTPVFDPAGNAEKTDSTCISCHLEGNVKVARAGRSMLDYRPGDNLSDFISYYVYKNQNPTARAESEVEQFYSSECKRKSGNRMSCTTCHDPHYTPPPAERVAYYRSKCLICHNSPSFLKTHYPNNPSCISCHMPHVGAQNTPHVAWTDHRILARPDESVAVQSTRTNVLEAIFSPGATQRDLGMAYYKAYLGGNRAEGPMAWSILSSQRPKLGNDPAALDALAVLSVERGDYNDGEAEFRRVLSLDPHDLTALSDLGVLLAKEGKLTESVQMLRSAFQRNEDVAGLAMDMARVECIAGNVAGVRSTLKTALIYNPGVAELEGFLQMADTCQSPVLNGVVR